MVILSFFHLTGRTVSREKRVSFPHSYLAPALFLYVWFFSELKLKYYKNGTNMGE
jgi:hypothetical protein